MTPLEERIELLIDSYGMVGLLEALDINPVSVIMTLIDEEEINEEDLYEL